MAGAQQVRARNISVDLFIGHLFCQGRHIRSAIAHQLLHFLEERGVQSTVIHVVGVMEQMKW